MNVLLRFFNTGVAKNYKVMQNNLITRIGAESMAYLRRGGGGDSCLFIIDSAEHFSPGLLPLGFDGEYMLY